MVGRSGWLKMAVVIRSDIKLFLGFLANNRWGWTFFMEIHLQVVFNFEKESHNSDSRFGFFAEQEKVKCASFLDGSISV